MSVKPKSEHDRQTKAGRIETHTRALIDMWDDPTRVAEHCASQWSDPQVVGRQLVKLLRSQPAVTLAVSGELLALLKRSA